ncbi:primosomal protein N' [Cohnella faecalis]|uniref:Replication restart protein PriA n=1 Tax=Cohnella faecalis TaxID=2315694 RepID=A0A398CYT3_9BACL|nr:primosomal protein N' [Cohnella faecalis]RIE04391.1 primosomal protein N' [Cohnella faecalis]
MTIARVIVDVPSRETDRPFDYSVPDSLRDWVEVGSRVAVPFAGRTLQGIVVALPGDAEVELSRLKAVSDVLDAVPPLSEELVKLGEWMSRRWLCPLTVAFQAMLPAALKGRTEKYVSVADDAVFSDEELAEAGALLHALRKDSATQAKLSALLTKFQGSGAHLKRWLKQGRLIERQKVENRLSVKTVLTVFPRDADTLGAGKADIPARARKQREVIEWLEEHPEPIALQELAEAAGTTASTIRSLEERGLLEIRGVTEDRDPYADRDFPVSSPLPLTPAQATALEPIASAIDAKDRKVFLLHGVTGSGKTEIYLQAIQQALSLGREAIVLVPEIALTPQMVERFKSRFGARVAVLHSRLSQGERFDEWRKIREGRAQVAVGARSAVFAPFSNIGLIVIDEEHETSYKQEESPKYHARDVAIERARLSGAAVVLGSATPSLETYEAALSGRAGPDIPHYISLPERVADRPLPGVTIVDMREELKLGNRAMFSRELADALRDRLAKGEQTVLLLNRRGYATFVMCRSCGHTVQCPHCDISLTHHKGSGNMRCHYCGYAETEPKTCPACQSPHIRFFGTGTQKVEESLAHTFPGIRVIRMDVDTTSEKGSHEKWLTEFRERRADVLLGTQMVAKGLDFPYVTLVGVLAADAALRLPDFRAAERTFQLLTQVAGRAGRHELPGEVIIQTYDPEHSSVASVQGHDYAKFTEQELFIRSQLGYPPYGRLIALTFSHESVPMLLSVGQRFASGLKAKAAELGLASTELDVLGPVPSPIPRLKDRYRFQCMVKYRGELAASALVAGVLQGMGEAVKKSGVLTSVDVDPQMML